MGLIIARGGSKRIPKKNIRAFANRGPIITIPIQSMLKSGVFHEIVVDTDSSEIASIAEAAGAAVPYLREPELAGDHATTLQVAKAAIRRLRLESDDILLLAYSTSYLTPQHYSEAIATFAEIEPGMLISVVPSGVSHSRLLRIEHNSGDLEFIYPEMVNARSQDIEVSFKDAGKFYIARVELWNETENVFSLAKPYVLPVEYGIDLDTLEDWRFAETVFFGMQVQREMQDKVALPPRKKGES